MAENFHFGPLTEMKTTSKLFGPDFGLYRLKSMVSAEMVPKFIVLAEIAEILILFFFTFQKKKALTLLLTWGKREKKRRTRRKERTCVLSSCHCCCHYPLLLVGCQRLCYYCCPLFLAGCQWRYCCCHSFLLPLLSPI